MHYCGGVDLRTLFYYKKIKHFQILFGVFSFTHNPHLPPHSTTNLSSISIHIRPAITLVDSHHLKHRCPTFKTHSFISRDVISGMKIRPTHFLATTAIKQHLDTEAEQKQIFSTDMPAGTLPATCTLISQLCTIIPDL